ncbi:hypothetical protein MARINON1_60128 [Marinobacter salarius]|nr:hypothetical protein MBHK15_100363 [Marinobacter salarius]VXC39846.1 hypothetical protein MARINON1_60128 [Marinobacter salarius]
MLIGAGNEIRTRDPNLGKVVLYQLSYSRLINEGVFYGLGRLRQPLFSTFCFSSDSDRLPSNASTPNTRI